MPDSENPIPSNEEKSIEVTQSAETTEENIESIVNDETSESTLSFEQPTSKETTPIRERRGIYLNAANLPKSKEAYVAWLDVMGSESAMSHSLLRSSNQISRLHIAILKHRNYDLQISPFMDGAYIRCNSQRIMLDFLRGVFKELAFDFWKAREHRHRFMPRCGLSFGNIIQGVDITEEVNYILGAEHNKVYREGIYFGYPIVQAFKSEKDAPPFGVSIHESARGFAPHGECPLSDIWWRWHIYPKVNFFSDFRKMLMKYFNWCKDHPTGLGYPVDRIKAHEAMAREFFDSETGV